MPKRIKLEIIALAVLILFAVVYFFVLVKYNFQQRISEENLQKFYELIKKDALFYDPNLDPVFLSAAVKKLRETELKVLAINKFYESDIDKGIFPADWHLWPVDFLSDLFLLNKATTNFLNSPKPESAMLLMAWYQRAVSDYKKAINNHITAMNTLLAKKTKLQDKKILFLGSATTPEIVLEDFLLIRKNAEELEHEMLRREQCLFRGKCKYTRKPIVAPEAFEAPKLDILPKNMIEEGDSYKIIDGPYYVNSRCWGAGEDAKLIKQPFYIMSKNDLIYSKLANEIYYEDYEKVVDNGNTKRALLFLEAGIPWLKKLETSYYRCTDLLFNPLLLSMYLLKQEISENGILLVEEAEFTKLVAPTDEDAFGLIRTYENVLNKNHLDVSQKTVIEKRLALLENQLAPLPYLLVAAAGDQTKYMIEGEVATKSALSAEYFLIVRSAYSMFFLTFSSSVWRIEEKAKFLLRVAGSLPLRLDTRYSELKDNPKFQEFLNKKRSMTSDILKNPALHGE